MASAMFMNSNSMPIALVQSLISSVAELKMSEDDTSSDMLGRALTYLVLYSTLGNIARWSFGVKILEKADDGAPDVVAEEKAAAKARNLEANAPDVQLNGEPKMVDVPLSASHSRGPSDTTTIAAPQTIGRANGRFFLAEDDDANGSGELSRTQTLLDVHEPRPPFSTQSSSATLAPQLSRAPSYSEDLPFPKSGFDPEEAAPQPPATPLRRFLRMAKRVWLGFYDFMTMPLWAALFSIIIALIPPVQNVIANHMAPLRAALEQAGDCSIPLTLVVLGAYFYTPPPKDAPKRSMKERLVGMFKRNDPAIVAQEIRPTIPGQKRAIAIAVTSRMLVTPLIVIPIILAFIKANFPPVFNEYASSFPFLLPILTET